MRAALAGDIEAISTSLAAEEAEERDLDRAYWAPLKAELEALRHKR